MLDSSDCRAMMVLVDCDLAPSCGDLTEELEAGVRGSGFHNRPATWAVAVCTTAGAGADSAALYPAPPLERGLSVRATVYPPVAAAVKA